MIETVDDENQMLEDKLENDRLYDLLEEIANKYATRLQTEHATRTPITLTIKGRVYLSADKDPVMKKVFEALGWIGLRESKSDKP